VFSRGRFFASVGSLVSLIVGLRGALVAVGLGEREQSGGCGASDMIAGRWEKGNGERNLKGDSKSTEELGK
jgi:hypothetical protein